MKALNRWMSFAEPGDRFVYHIGFLCVDRLKLRRHEGDLAQGLARAGLVALTQRRLGSGQYEYIATRMSQSSPSLTWTCAYDD
jgi:hypothetical protein